MGETLWDFLTLSDVFIVGIGFDLAGAYLLAKGLLTRPAQMVAGGLNAAAMGYSPETIYDRARDYVDARTGIVALCLGFTLQAVGYLLLIGTSAEDSTGLSQVIGAVVLAALAMGAVLGGHFWRRDRMGRNVVKKVALTYAGGVWDDRSTIMALQVARKAGWVTVEQHGLVANDNLLFNQRLPVLRDVYGVDIPAQPD